MAKMIGTVTVSQGCTFGKTCTCNGYYRDTKMVRVSKRRERQAWKRQIRRDEEN